MSYPGFRKTSVSATAFSSSGMFLGWDTSIVCQCCLRHGKTIMAVAGQSWKWIYDKTDTKLKNNWRSMSVKEYVTEDRPVFIAVIWDMILLWYGHLEWGNINSCSWAYTVTANTSSNCPATVQGQSQEAGISVLFVLLVEQGKWCRCSAGVCGGWGHKWVNIAIVLLLELVPSGLC